jgi:hypothetical protein
MNFKTPGFLSVLGIAIAAGCLGLPWRAMGEATAIVGNCAEFDCPELLNELEESFRFGDRRSKIPMYRESTPL